VLIKLLTLKYNLGIKKKKKNLSPNIVRFEISPVFDRAEIQG